MQPQKHHEHHCHWPGCDKYCHPKEWGCARHWLLVPLKYKHALIKNYRPGQEVDKNPSDKYIDAAVELHHYCIDQNKRNTGYRLVCV
jgi:hypothetical protein